MKNTKAEAVDVSGTVKAAAAELARLRGRPCLALVVPMIQRGDILDVLDRIPASGGENLDVIIASHGGDIETAYVMARTLRRRFQHLTAYVPLCACSAATLLCLAMDEIVMGELGALGPLDGQWPEAPTAEHPNASKLLPFKALGQLEGAAVSLFEEAFGVIFKVSEMRAADATSKAAELTGNLLGPLYARVDPMVVAKAARGLEVGSEYAARILRRYRPELAAEAGSLIQRLVHAYPSHGFALDLEELLELGLSARAAEGEEMAILDGVARALVRADEQGKVIDLAIPSDREEGDEMVALDGRLPATPPASVPARTAERLHRRSSRPNERPLIA